MRLVLPLPDRADYAVAGVPPRAVPAHRPPGRALLGEDAAECQLALPRRRPRLPAGTPRPRAARMSAPASVAADPDPAERPRPALAARAGRLR